MAIFLCSRRVIAFRVAKRVVPVVVVVVVVVA